MSPEPSSAPAARPERSRAAVLGEKALEALIRLCGVSAILFVAAIFFFVLREAAPVLFSERFSLGQFLFSTEWYPTSATNVRYGTLALTVGTVSVTALAMLLAVPFGLGAAIYLSEFCSPRLRETLKVVIELLSAIPSVVWGFVGLTVMSKVIVKMTGAPVGVNVLNGGIILALMSVPVIVSIGEDALKAVPDSYREAGIALGTTRWQLVYRVLVPAARNGLLAAVLLGVGRAVGETMAVLMATGHAVHIPHGTPRLRADSHRQHRRRARRGALRIRPLPRPLPHRDAPLPHHPRREPDGRLHRPRNPEEVAVAGRFARTPHVARKELAQAVAKGVFALMSAAMILPLLLIVGYLIVLAWPSLSWEFLLDVPKRGMTDGGIWPAFVGTLYLVGISLLVSAPIGVLAAIYLNEYAKDNWFTRLVNLAVINLAGVPSIVHALFGLGAFVYAARFGYSILSASLTLAIMTLPVIIASTREALASVPMAFREACWNVGATRWQTIRAVVLPNSISGILTGVILQVSRAAGETAPIMFTGAVFFKAVERGHLFPYGLTDQCMALSMHLYTLATQVPNVKESLPYATAVVLLGSVLLVNATAIVVRIWLRGRKKW